MFIAHYTGEGYGFMAGVGEYVELYEDEPTEEQLEAAPGFELSKLYDTDIESDYSSLPLERVLHA